MRKGLILLLLIAQFAAAQEKIRTGTLSPRFTGAAGTPRITRNEESRTWAVAWRQPGASPSVIVRTVPAEGAPGPPRQLTAGVAATEKAFDLVYTRPSASYWLAYESPEGLRIRQFAENWVSRGTARIVEHGVRQSLPRWVFDRARDRLSLFWLGSAARTLRRVTLDSSGTIMNGNRTLYTAPSGSSLVLLDAEFNPKNGFIVCLLMQKDSVSTELLAVRINAAGAALPIVHFAKYDGNLALDAAVAFSTVNGQGFVIWTAGAGPLRYRLLKADGIPAAAARDLAGEQQSGAGSVSAYFDSKNNRFVSAWTRMNEVRAAAFHPQTASVTLEPFTLASSASGTTMHVQSSFGPSRADAICAWEEHDGDGYVVRSATFEIRTEEFVVQGRIQSKKIYDPPFVVNGVPYLMKYHVLNGGRIYRAYVTPETEFLGRKPDTGDWIRMIFDPFRSRFRGYIEAVRVIPPPAQAQ